MIKGIPYLGVEHNNIIKEIFNANIKNTVEYDCLYNLITYNMYKNLLVIIDNCRLTWLKDIQFNYRDKKIVLPYYDFQETDIENIAYRTDRNGHIQLSEDQKTVRLRHDFIYKEKELNIDKFILNVYDLDTSSKYELKLKENKWYTSDKFSLEELYNKYLDSCYVDDDFNIVKHESGYHYIDKQVDKFENTEKKLRELLGYNNYDFNNTFSKDYRDVRNFKYEQVVSMVGFRENNTNYKLRRLEFEVLLYCILRQECIPEEYNFINIWNRLGVTKDYIKYGSNIKLIFKSYWLNKYKPIKQKTWHKIER